MELKFFVAEDPSPMMSKVVAVTSSNTSTSQVTIFGINNAKEIKVDSIKELYPKYAHLTNRESIRSAVSLQVLIREMDMPTEIPLEFPHWRAVIVEKLLLDMANTNGAYPYSLCFVRKDNDDDITQPPTYSVKFREVE